MINRRYDLDVFLYDMKHVYGFFSAARWAFMAPRYPPAIINLDRTREVVEQNSHNLILNTNTEKLIYSLIFLPLINKNWLGYFCEGATGGTPIIVSLWQIMNL